MRILVLANNWLGWQVVAWLREQGEELAALALHPPEQRRYGGELVEAAGLPPEWILDGARLRQPQVLDRVREARPEIGLSVMFRYLLRAELLQAVPRGVLNLHPGYLPYNRGVNANVWAIVDRTPAGCALHWVDEGIDTGPIVARREVPVEPVDTGASLYRKLEQAALAMFQETWPAVRAGRAPALPQVPGEGSQHGARDLERIDRIDLERTYTARELIDVLRARTFPPYRGAYFEYRGRRVYLRLDLAPEPEEPDRGI